MKDVGHANYSNTLKLIILLQYTTLGNHVCWVKLKNRRVEKKEELFKTYDCAQNLVTGKEMCINKVADYVSKGMVTEARQAASALKDFKKTKHTIERSNPLYHEDLNSFDAVGILKKKMDETDPFHIYVMDHGPSAPAHGLRDSGELCLPLKGAVLSLALLLVWCLR